MTQATAATTPPPRDTLDPAGSAASTSVVVWDRDRLQSVFGALPLDLERLRANVAMVRGKIAEAESRAGRPAGSARLVAVTKYWPAEWLAPLAALGADTFGENHPQAVWSKVPALASWRGPDGEILTIHWHLIGHLQSNKARRTLPMVEMIHGVDSLKLLKTLDQLAANVGTATTTSHPPAQVCLQVNLSGEASKHGWSAEGLMADAQEIAALRSISIVGLMTMAALGTDTRTARPTFEALRELRDRFAQASGLTLPELSMGMSNDYEAAVEAGSTLVRIGSALIEGVALQAPPSV